MSAQNPTYVCSSGLKPTPVATMMFKIHDLSRDVDCLKVIYDESADPNKERIERVLSHMKKKLGEADQLLSFGQSAIEYSVTGDRTRTLLRRFRKLKQLFKDLIKGQRIISTPERRSLSQMFHQLLSLEEDLVHFTDPGNSGSSSGRCRKSNDEAHWNPAQNCEMFAIVGGANPQVQALLLDDTPLSKMASFDNVGMEERIVCCTYPEIEEPSEYGEDETRHTVFSITDRRESSSLFTNGVSSHDYLANNRNQEDCADGISIALQNTLTTAQ